MTIIRYRGISIPPWVSGGDHLTMSAFRLGVDLAREQAPTTEPSITKSEDAALKEYRARCLSAQVVSRDATRPAVRDQTPEAHSEAARCLNAAFAAGEDVIRVRVSDEGDRELRVEMRRHDHAAKTHEAAAEMATLLVTAATEPEPPARVGNKILSHDEQAVIIKALADMNAPMPHDLQQYEHVAATMTEVLKVAEGGVASRDASMAAGMAGLAAQMAQACGVDHRGWEFARAGWRAAAGAWAAVAKRSEFTVTLPDKPGVSEGCWSMRFPHDGETVSTVAAYDRAVLCGKASDAWMAKTGGTPR